MGRPLAGYSLSKLRDDISRGRIWCISAGSLSLVPKQRRESEILCRYLKLLYGATRGLALLGVEATHQTQVAELDMEVRIKRQRFGGEKKMEKVKSKRAARKKLLRGIASLAIFGAMMFFIGVAAVGTAYAQATRIQQSERILQPAGDVVEHDTFGVAVAISGNGKTMVIGAENADGNEVGAGAAFIFDKIDNNWVQTARLFAPDGHAMPIPSEPGDFASDAFGSNVAIDTDGNTVIAGAPFHNHDGHSGNAGAVYVFQRVNGVWSQQAELLPPLPHPGANFGGAPDAGGIGISGSTIVLTDQGNAIGTVPSSVDVFTRNNGTWALTTQLFVPDDFSFFPSSLAFNGSTLAVGSDGSDAPSAFFAGVVYVFRFSQGQWSAPVTLSAADATSGALFGFNLSLSGNLIAVGASAGPGATAQSGAAYVFASEEGVWSQKAKLIAGDGLDQDSFGVSISVNGQTVLVGATGQTPPATGVFAAGSAYVFQPNDGKWQQIDELTASDGISGGSFGASVAVLHNTLLVGADGQHPPVEGYAGGEAYIYNLKP